MRKKYRKLEHSLDKYPIEHPVTLGLKKEDNILIMGSCFSLELGNKLKKQGYNILDMPTTGDEEQLIWYNTYTLLYEFQRITGDFVQDQNDIWELKNGTYQDPYRRCLFGENKKQLWERIDFLNKTLSKYIRSADCIVMTLGTTEVFMQNNGRYICATPGYPKGKGGGQGCEFCTTFYQDNLDNMLKIKKIMEEINHNCWCVTMVSPIPLSDTNRNIDNAVANMEGKSVLRSVAGFIEDYNTWLYYPLMENIMIRNRKTVYKPDGRHIKPEYIDYITNDFVKFLK